MQFKALRMALAVGFLMTTAAVVSVTMLEHSLVGGAGARAEGAASNEPLAESED